MSSTSINCPKCGASLSGDSLYCNYCGTAIADVRDLLKKKAELELQKKENEEQLRKEMAQHKMKQRQNFSDIAILLIGSAVILIMIFMASR